MAEKPNRKLIQPATHHNVSFYEDKIAAKPNHESIEEILTFWHDDFNKLEINYDYIQWLFPIQEQGLNKQSFPLSSEEAKKIRETAELKSRVKRAFEMMLNFYGMKLTKSNQFELTKESDERLRLLNKKQNYNFLRITRILKSLKELGYHELMLPWLKFLADLIYKEKKLNHAKSSFEEYWVPTLDAKDYEKLKNHVIRLRESELQNSTNNYPHTTVNNSTNNNKPGIDRVPPTGTSNLPPNSPNISLPPSTSPVTSMCGANKQTKRRQNTNIFSPYTTNSHFLLFPTQYKNHYSCD